MTNFESYGEDDDGDFSEMYIHFLRALLVQGGFIQSHAGRA